nr:right-handed parallel beta-helix repeat-containing protein [Pseudoalteromonas sp. C2R02]
MKGVYHQKFHSIISGTKQEPITIKGNVSTIVKGLVNNIKSKKIVEIKHSYIHLKGFTIDGHSGEHQRAIDYKDKLLLVQGNEQSPIRGVEIKGMRVLNALGECIRLKDFTQYTRISNNIIKNCGLKDYKFGRGKKNGEAIYIGTAPEQLKSKSLDTSSYNEIKGNNLDPQGGECIDIKEGANHNLIAENNCFGGLDIHSGSISIRSSFNRIIGNYIFDNHGSGIRIGGDTKGIAIDNYVVKNLLINNQFAALKIMDWPQKSVCRNQIHQKKGNKWIKVKSGIDKSAILRCNYGDDI